MAPMGLQLFAVNNVDRMVMVTKSHRSGYKTSTAL
jgi:hypothetical protein